VHVHVQTRRRAPPCPSGTTPIVGLNGRRLQPSIAAIGSLGKVPKLPAFAHESASIVDCSGPVHDVGNASSGGGCGASEWTQGVWKGSSRVSSMQPQPRARADL
jgi:hypothetical protein